MLGSLRIMYNPCSDPQGCCSCASHTPTQIGTPKCPTASGQVLLTSAEEGIQGAAVCGAHIEGATPPGQPERQDACSHSRAAQAQCERMQDMSRCAIDSPSLVLAAMTAGGGMLQVGREAASTTTGAARLVGAAGSRAGSCGVAALTVHFQAGRCRVQQHPPQPLL